MKHSKAAPDAVTVDYVDSVGVVRLNRPDRLNAWNHEISSGLDTALLDCSEDPKVRAVVITGAGRAFCAGADLSGGSDTLTLIGTATSKTTVRREPQKCFRIKCPSQ